MATQARAAAKSAGIEIWSIHMAYSKQIDLSTINDTAWQRILKVHSKILKEVVAILQPKIVLFHPSWYLGLHERP